VRALAVVLAAGLSLPLTAAHADHARGGCDNKRAHTFSSALSKPPAKVKAGSRMPVTITVKRAGQLPADAVEVGLTLRGGSWFGYGYGTTDSNGVVSTVVKVPTKARGKATLVVDVHRQLISLPCGNIEEYDFIELPWGTVVK
jgi:hypothetical protein